MNKIGFVFPGQGAQYVGMGKKLYESSFRVKRIFDSAQAILGYDFKNLCFEGPERELNMTENTQPAVLTTSYAAARIIIDEGLQPDMIAGFSLGEYSALLAAGSLKFEDALRLVRKRAQIIQDSVPFGVGGMAVIVGLSIEEVSECCKMASDVGKVELSNYNAPAQTTISGNITALNLACDYAKQKGAKQVVNLPVSAPFHSSLLAEASERFKPLLQSISFGELQVPVISNVTALPYNSSEDISQLLVQHISHPVLWEQSVRYMIGEGIDTFVEIGPGKVLSKLVKKIDSTVKTYNVDCELTLANTLKALQRGAA